MEKTVIELFAGVGGFRVGLNNVKLIKDKVVEEDNFKFVWANQWEPATKMQHAFDCYQARFGKSEHNSNLDISLVDKKSIPNHTLLVGGFPCQDYSVARTLSGEKGIEGKKGVLFWQIVDIAKAKKPPFMLLENVDRLIKSPSKQRGRDFGIMLRCLSDLGYGIEWRIINAAEYGHPQRRRRIYIFAFHKSTNYFKAIKKSTPEQALYNETIFAKAFPIQDNSLKLHEINVGKDEFDNLVDFSDKFKAAFENAGICLNANVFTSKYLPVYEEPIPLKKTIEKHDMNPKLFLDEKREEKFKYLKGSKKIPREKNGIIYNYSEGAMAFPETLSLPSRTMLTSEGSVNRSTHVVKDVKTGKLRILSPVECERLNQFPDNWTNTGMPDSKRYFMMGNALVTGIISKLGVQISDIIDKEI